MTPSDLAQWVEYCPRVVACATGMWVDPAAAARAADEERARMVADAARLRALPPMPRQYIFNVHKYDSYYSVVESTADKALAALKRHLRTAAPSEYRRDWRQATLDSLPAGYYVEVCDVGGVYEHSHD